MSLSSTTETIIEPNRGLRHYWRELWAYRELFLFLTWRDILVRYKQTAIGVLWSIIRPLMTMVVFTVVFGRVAKLPADGDLPYPLMVFAATLPWQLFASAFQTASTSLVGQKALLTKVYFPRLIIPAISPLVALTDFLISFMIYIFMMIYYGVSVGWPVLTLPFFILMSMSTAFGASLILTTLNVKYRDFQYVVPFVIQMGLFISPVGFSSSVVPERWRLLYSCNPMVGVIDGFRWALLGGDSKLYMPGFYLSMGLVLMLLLTGIWIFRRFERGFADII